MPRAEQRPPSLLARRRSERATHLLGLVFPTLATIRSSSWRRPGHRLPRTRSSAISASVVPEVRGCALGCDEEAAFARRAARWATPRQDSPDSGSSRNRSSAGRADARGRKSGQIALVPALRAGADGTHLVAISGNYRPFAARCTLPTLSSSCAAIVRIEWPRSRRRRIRRTTRGSSLGFLPKRVPRRRAAATPARVRSRMRSRSNSAIDARTWKSSRPASSPLGFARSSRQASPWILANGSRSGSSCHSYSA